MTRGEFTAMLSRWFEDAADSAFAAPRPIVIGMSGAQGSGKTTLRADVCEQMRVASGSRVVDPLDRAIFTSRMPSSSPSPGANLGTAFLQHRLPRDARLPHLA